MRIITLEKTSEMSIKWRVMMIGTDLYTKGGISSVVQGYFREGIMDRLGIHYYHTHRDGSKLDKIILYIKALLKIVQNMPKYDIVHLHLASWWSFRRLIFLIILARIYCKKVVIHLHGAKFDIYYREALSVEKAIIRYGFSLADRVIVLSVQWLEKIKPFCNSNKSLIVPNTVNVCTSKESILNKKINKPNTILFMGELGSRKGIYDFLEAIRLLNKPEVKVYLCGNGEIEEVKRRVVRLGLEGIVSLHGWVRGEKKKLLLDEAYIYVLPSYFEGLPMSILEAMATGTPVISTPVGGIPDVVKNGYNGFLVPTNSPQKIADKIHEILNDGALWSRLSENAISTIHKKFSMKETERKLTDLYRGMTDYF